MFKIIRGSGFHITFENGVTVSVQFSRGSYCNKYPNNDMYDKDIKFDKDMNIIKDWKDPLPLEGSPNAEVAIWNKKGNWITEKYLESIGEDEDDVIGFQTAEQVLDILNWAKSYKEGE
jgi:hypothetical protein